MQTHYYSNQKSTNRNKKIQVVYKQQLKLIKLPVVVKSQRNQHAHILAVGRQVDVRFLFWREVHLVYISKNLFVSITLHTVVYPNGMLGGTKYYRTLFKLNIS